MAGAEAILETAKRAFAAGNLAEARRFCDLALDADPGMAGPWIVLADIELRRGRPEAATAMADKAVALEPENPFGYFVRCNALIASSRLNEAARTADYAVQMQSCPPALLDGFGNLFNRLRRYEQARTLYERAVAAEPDNPAFLYRLAVAERTLGALDRAERRLDHAIARDSHIYDAFFMRADLRKQTAERNHVAEMEALLAAGVRDTRGEIALRYALGKEYDDLGDYPRAFGHFGTGARLQRERLPYDTGGNVAVVNRIIASHTRDVLGTLSASGRHDRHTNDNPIFIVGLPRSGTTLVERIVGGHSAVFAAGELGTLPSELIRAAKAAGVTREGEWVERLPSIDLAALGQAYSRIAREYGVPIGRRFIDKYPPNFLLCGVIRAALPKAKIIVLRRQPMDVCLALYKTLFNTGIYPYSYDLGKLAEYYDAFRRLIDHWRVALPKDCFLEVSYEGLVADFEQESRRLLSFLDLPWEDGVLRFHESTAPSATASATQIRQPVYSSAVGKWRHYAEQLAPLRARLAELVPADQIEIE